MANSKDNPNITDARLKEALQRTMERLTRGIEELTYRIGRLEIQNQARERIPPPAQHVDQYEGDSSNQQEDNPHAVTTRNFLLNLRSLLYTYHKH